MEQNTPCFSLHILWIWINLPMYHDSLGPRGLQGAHTDTYIKTKKFKIDNLWEGVSLHFGQSWPIVRRGRSVAVCAAFIRNHDAFDRLTHYFLSPLQLKSFVAIVGTWQLYLQWHKYGAPNMALKYEWGFYPRWNYIVHSRMAKTNVLLMSLKSEKLLRLVLCICFYI